MAASLLLRGHPLLRFGLWHRGLCSGVVQVTRRSCCTATAASTPPDGSLTSAENTASVSSASQPTKYQRWCEPDYRKWKDQEDEILSDVEPVISLTKEIIHSNRFIILPRKLILNFIGIICLFFSCWGTVRENNQVKICFFYMVCSNRNFPSLEQYIILQQDWRK